MSLIPFAVLSVCLECLVVACRHPPGVRDATGGNALSQLTSNAEFADSVLECLRMTW
jgi:hypothetical protein